MIRSLTRRIHRRVSGLRAWLAFWARYGFPPPPAGTDLVGYAGILDHLRIRRILDLPGDLVEIGCLLGGGTYCLAQFAKRWNPAKHILAIDLFVPGADQSHSSQGLAMAKLYADRIAAMGTGETQWQIFSRSTRGCDNILPMRTDSALLELNRKVCFAFLDGNHSVEYVRGDFNRVWRHVVPGGELAFHDYRFDLPEVTATIDKLIAENNADIAAAFEDCDRHIVYLERAS